MVHFWEEKIFFNVTIYLGYTFFIAIPYLSLESRLSWIKSKQISTAAAATALLKLNTNNLSAQKIRCQNLALWYFTGNELTDFEKLNTFSIFQWLRDVVWKFLWHLYHKVHIRHIIYVVVVLMQWMSLL